MVSHSKEDNKLNDPLGKPLITIAIPFYNAERFLRYSILSVINQTYQNWELQLINDGGNDNSVSIAEEFASADSRIKVISDGKNKGLPSRLNETIQMAKGEFYARMDADDIMFPNRLEKQIAFAKSHPDADVIGGQSVIINEKNKIIFSSKGESGQIRTKEEIMGGKMFIHPTVFGKTKWFLNHPYDEAKRRSQDYFLWLSSVEESSFIIMDEPVLFYRVLNKEILGKFKKDNELERQFLVSKLKEQKTPKSIMLFMKNRIRLYLFYCYYYIVGSERVLARRYNKLRDDEKANYERIMNQAINSVSI